MKKLIVGSMTCMLVIFGWGTHEYWGTGATPRGELRIVDKHPGNWASVTLHVFEHLIELDKDGKLVPRLATSWQWRDDRTLDVTLRQGITFHNGEVFDAEIVKLNWEENTRLGQPHIGGAFMNFPRITPGDPRCADRALHLPRAGRSSLSQAERHASRQPPILSRHGLGREALVNHRRRRPVGHGPI